ncbi:MAG: 2,3-bisphosphoglycerate-independent phosphoglycerate mutase [Planctomycetes bacterium]|nr:2,3-bisphosphoglycerate-independent phosphoglycerate mutase [Planctomycetota bacterium]
MPPIPHSPVVLIVRDGWGANPHPEWNHANAVHLARTPVDDGLMAAYPHVLIHTSGNDVGLPEGVMGNSEVGHQNIGAGRVVEQEIMRITGRIRDGAFFRNPGLLGAYERAAQRGGAVHIMGLCSDGRVHSDLEHLYGLLELARRARFPGDRVFIHAFTDGRDTPPTAGLGYLEQIEARCRDIGVGRLATVVGRYYAMDRDNRWDRVEKAYRLLVHGEGEGYASAGQALRHYYDHPTESSRSGDEFVVPSVIAAGGGPPATIRDGDSVIFFNYRGDRPRELSKAFVLDAFPMADPARGGATLGFDRGRKVDVHFVTMTAYETGLPVHVAFDKPEKMADILGACVADRGLTQFRCAETEKYPHVTFFFNDYRDEPFPGEERQLIPSPRGITTYDQKPEMSAYEVTNAVLARLAARDDALLVINYANGDMVGHTGRLDAAIRAVETVDECVGRVVQAVQRKGGGLIVTADHGNCEQMIDPATGGPHTAHTTYDVELIVVDDRFRGRRLRSGGRLADIAPTALTMLELPIPGPMSGSSLLA